MTVEVWDKGVDGAPDRLSHVDHIDHPTAMVCPTIHNTRYLVVKEA